ncbi:MAG: helix-turn-helix transcriptional regulator [Clostridia bacterium]|nr:helix-turn-helix transcriptional regulator [Clostridia bacterium]
MILADKIIRLRKMNGWSQEELAEKMNVSRQAVSKWEAAQTTPDLEKILRLGDLFGVSTDYLLKDEIENEQFTDSSLEKTGRCVTMEEANAYLEHRRWASWRIAAATFLCILAPIWLLMMGAMSQKPNSGMTDEFAVFFGLAVMFVFAAAAVAVYIYVGAKNGDYKYLEEENFELAYGVAGMVKDKQKKFRETYVRSNIIGTCLCILAPVLLFIGSITKDEVAMVFFLSLMMVVACVGVMFFIVAGVRWASMERLLQTGEFSEKGRKQSKLADSIGTAYWLVATAVYLGWSFMTNNWETTWIVWPVAGVLFAALMAVLNVVADKKED